MKSTTGVSSLEARVARLEKVVFGVRTKKTALAVRREDFSGPKGGVLLLLSKGFFAKQKSAVQVVAELKGLGYVGYQKQVIQNALNRLSENKGILIAANENGVRMYAKRK